MNDIRNSMTIEEQKVTSEPGTFPRSPAPLECSGFFKQFIINII